MTRFLAIVALIALLWIALELGLQKFRRSPTGRQLSSIWRVLSGVRTAATRATAPPQARQATSQLVRCSVCEVHVAKDRCYTAPGETAVYCSEACAQAAARGPRA